MTSYTGLALLDYYANEFRRTLHHFILEPDLFPCIAPYAKNQVPTSPGSIRFVSLNLLLLVSGVCL
jgi:hypothetical protein